LLTHGKMPICHASARSRFSGARLTVPEQDLDSQEHALPCLSKIPIPRTAPYRA
jgi:hypothetical protein